MLNVIRGKVKIRDIYEIYSFIKGNETLLCINLDKKYDQEWHLLIKHDWYFKSLCYLAIKLETFK